MKLSKPSLGTVLGGLALLVAMSTTAVAATGTIVNIADPTVASRVARVDPSGRLQVGGLVSTQPAPPTTLWRAVGIADNCTVIAAPPAGKTVIVRELSATVYGGTATDFDGLNFVTFYNNNSCSGLPIWDLMPTGNGTYDMHFDPGLGIPPTGALSAQDYSNKTYDVEVYAAGYLAAHPTVTAFAPTTKPQLDSPAPAAQ